MKVYLDRQAVRVLMLVQLYQAAWKARANWNHMFVINHPLLLLTPLPQHWLPTQPLASFIVPEPTPNDFDAVFQRTSVAGGGNQSNVFCCQNYKFQHLYISTGNKFIPPVQISCKTQQCKLSLFSFWLNFSKPCSVQHTKMMITHSSC